MISSYRELVDYIVGIDNLSEDVIANINNATMDLSGNIGYRVEVNLENFVVSYLKDNILTFNDRIKRLDFNMEEFHLALIDLKNEFHLLDKFSKNKLLSPNMQDKLTSYVREYANKYQESLLEGIDNEQMKMMIINTDIRKWDNNEL